MMASMDLGAQGVAEEFTDIAEFIKERIWQDTLSADLQWSLFVSAVNSYRHDTVLRPFPRMFITENGEKDLESLKSFIAMVPPFSQLPRTIHTLPSKLLELLKWVLDAKAFTLLAVDKDKYKEFCQLTGQTVKCPEPKHIFEVTQNAVADDKFIHLRNGRNLLYAYHGSRLDNFYSILHNGLASHMNKTSIFGEGTYLSSELSVSMIYSPTGIGWEHSELADSLSCVTLCEMIDDPAVKCQDKSISSDNDGSEANLRHRANAGPSEGGDVPEKYYVVQNNEVIRVKYLLVFGYRTRPYRAHPSLHRSWISKHRFALMILVYIAILCAIGLLRSEAIQHMWRKIWRHK